MGVRGGKRQIKNLFPMGQLVKEFTKIPLGLKPVPGGALPFCLCNILVDCVFERGLFFSFFFSVVSGLLCAREGKAAFP